MGYKPEVSEKPKNLYGFQNDKRKQKAHIVIPRSQVGSASNDLGFERVNDNFIMHISEYDISSKKFNTNKLKQLYAKNRLKKSIKKKGVKYSLRSEKLDKYGNIKIKIRLRG